MSQLIGLLRDSDSWRVRLDVLLPLQSELFLSSARIASADEEHDTTVLYFHNIFQLDDSLIAQLLEQLCDLLRDPKVRAALPFRPTHQSR